MSKPMTLPDLERATRTAIDQCYGNLIDSDPRWAVNLPQYHNISQRKGRRASIELICTYSHLPQKRGT